MNAIIHPYPNSANKYEGSQNLNTIQVCTAKKARIMTADTARHIFKMRFIHFFYAKNTNAV